MQVIRLHSGDVVRPASAMRAACTGLVQAHHANAPISTAMERGLYIAASGMMSDIVRQDVIAANLANVSTAGYKGDRVVNETFGDNLLYSMRNGTPEPMGTMNYGTRVAGTITDFSQGSFRSTQGPLDVAIGGDGFFAVRQADGTTAYTRNGQFTRTPDGFLTTQDGQYVLGPDKLPVFAGTDGDPVIRADGRVAAKDGSQLGQIGIVTLDIPSARKVGDNNWVGTETGGMPGTTQIKQGFIEASSVNSVKEMVEMITTMRSYESSQRVITSIDGTLDKAVNSVGTLG
jgi:flagellar basal-body rod protein FlgG